MNKNSLKKWSLTALSFMLLTVLGVSFYLWYTSDISSIESNTIEAAVESSVAVEYGDHIGGHFTQWTQSLRPRFMVFTEDLYSFLVKTAHQYKFNLLWRYRHKNTVLAIFSFVVFLLTLFLAALRFSFAVGRRQGKKDSCCRCN